MTRHTNLNDLSWPHAYAVTIPAGTAMRAVALMVAHYGVKAAGDALVEEALASGREATFQGAMRFAAGRLDDLDRLLEGEQTELAAYRRLKAAHKAAPAGRTGGLRAA
jgi:hypothetical protein